MSGAQREARDPAMGGVTADDAAELMRDFGAGFGDVIARIRDLSEAEPPAGWEERVAARLAADTTCPWCGAGDAFAGDAAVAGDEWRCWSCGRPIAAVALRGGGVAFCRGRRAPWRRSARQRSRDRRRRRGW